MKAKEIGQRLDYDINANKHAQPERPAQPERTEPNEHFEFIMGHRMSFKTADRIIQGSLIIWVLFLFYILTKWLLSL